MPEFVTEDGRVLHGQVAVSAAAGAERRADAADLRAAVQDDIRLTIEAAGGIDGVRAKLGEEAALRLARRAGLDVARITERWRDESPVVRSQTLRGGDGYDRDPAHHPRVVEAIMAGRSMREVNAVMGQVAAEMRRSRKPTSAEAVAAAHQRDRDERAAAAVAADERMAAKGFHRLGESSMYVRIPADDDADGE